MDRLPIDILRTIFHSFTLQDLLNAALVCKTWKEVIFVRLSERWKTLELDEKKIFCSPSVLLRACQSKDHSFDSLSLEFPPLVWKVESFEPVGKSLPNLKRLKIFMHFGFEDRK